MELVLTDKVFCTLIFIVWMWSCTCRCRHWSSEHCSICTCVLHYGTCKWSILAVSQMCDLHMINVNYVSDSEHCPRRSYCGEPVIFFIFRDL